MSNVLLHTMDNQWPLSYGGRVHEHKFQNGWIARVREGGVKPIVYTCEVRHPDNAHSACVDNAEYASLYLVNLWLADVAAMNEFGQRGVEFSAEPDWWDR